MMRVAWVIVLAVLVCAAGCAAPQLNEPGQDPVILPTAPQFDAPVLIGGGGELETSLVVRDQTWLVCEMGAGEADVLHASLDGGATWRRVPVVRGLQASTDCDMAIGPDGTWFIIFLDTVGEQVVTGDSVTDGLLTFGSSTDQGATWTWTTLPGYVNGAVDRPWIRVLDDGTLYLTHKSGNVLPLTVWFQRSNDNGMTWSVPTLVARGSATAHPNGNVGKMVVSDGGDTIRLPLHTFDSQEGEGRDEWLDLAVSNDGGATWTVKPVVGPVTTRVDHFLPTLGLANGTLYVSVPLTNGTTKADLTLVTSSDGGDTWSEGIALAYGQGFGEQGSEAGVALEAGPNGTMDAAWYHWQDGWIVAMARLQGQEILWKQDITEPAGKDLYLEFLGLAHDAAGRALVAYPVPLDPCPEGGRDCIYLVAESNG